MVETVYIYLTCDGNPFCLQVAHCNDSPKLLAELFGCYDPSCTGKVPLRVVRNILQNCGEVLTNDEVNAVLEASTEEVDYKAFCERSVPVESTVATRILMCRSGKLASIDAPGATLTSGESYFFAGCCWRGDK